MVKRIPCGDIAVFYADENEPKILPVDPEEQKGLHGSLWWDIDNKTVHQYNGAKQEWVLIIGDES